MFKLKKILLFTTLLILLVGVANATETVQEEQLCTTDQTVASDTNTISQLNEKIIRVLAKTVLFE
jgi:hypothetical protein